MTAERLKFLEFIQNIITRMNANSFQIKAMCIAVISALFAVYAANGNKTIVYVSLIPLILCCFLDTYYLWQERKFRILYDEVRKGKNDIEDLNLGTFKSYNKKCSDYLKALCSLSVLPFYSLIGICSFILKEIL